MEILIHYIHMFMLRLFSTPVILTVFLSSALVSGGLNAQTGSTTSFDINIPKRGSGEGSKAIFQVEATIVMEGTGTVDFRITDPEGEIQDFSLDASTVCVGVDPATNPCLAEFPDPGTGQSGDAITWELPTAGVPGDDDPQNVTYKLTINPLSNTDFVSSPGECLDSMPVPMETFNIEVVSGPEITGACLVSYDLTASGAECSDLGPPIQTPPLATIDAGSGTEQFCQQLRPGVDSTLVLDKSGSMNSSPIAGPSARKIDALKIAVDKFVDRWGEIRSAEATSPEASLPNDNIGVILFNSDASWLGDATGLGDFDTVAPTISDDMALVTGGGLTSIGDGLFMASNALFSGPLAGNGNRKTILLMSDGKENAHRRVRLWDNNESTVLQWSKVGDISAAEFQSRINIQLGSDATGWSDLPHESNLRIYTVTVGSSTAVSAEINQGIAMATGGFYINSETNADILSAYFIELLQNFVKFNTWNVVALRSAEVGVSDGAQQSYSIDFPLPSTSRAASIDVTWNPDFGHLCLEVRPPAADYPETVCSHYKGQSAGQLSWSKLLVGKGGSYSSTSDWKAIVRPAVGGALADTSVAREDTRGDRQFPVSLVIMSEDSTVNSDFTIEAGDYVPGSGIPLRVSLKESGRALLSGVTVSAQVASPSQSIGDLLSASNAGTEQPDTCPGGCDIDSPADAKLANELKDNPEALQSDFDTINFVDNGDASSGDLVAGDGVYSAIYQADAPGHHNVLFRVHGSTERSGNVHREQLISFVVRSAPDSSETVIDSSISADPNTGQNSLDVNFTPKTRGGSLLGPGWANYFWFAGPAITPFKASDNLDGTYSAVVNFMGEAPPALTLHFLDVAQAIEDSVTADALPIPLEEGTAISVVVPGNGVSACQWYDLTCGAIWLKYLILILILLLILFLLFKRSSSKS